MKRALATVIFFAVLPPLLVHTEWAYVLRLLGLMGLYMILGLGLNIVVGYLGMLDLGFAAFYAIGAYTMALLSINGVNFWAALPLSIFIAMAIRAVLGAPVLRLRGDYLAIVTLGFGEITRIVLNNWDGLTNGPKGLSLLSSEKVQPIRILGVALYSNLHFYYLIFAAVLIGVALSHRLQYSRTGRAWMAIREDETAARLTGIQITRMKMIAFVASAAFAGAAGALFARWENFVTPESFTFWESVSLVAMVVIGGMGSVPGTLFGVAIVVLVPELLRNVLGAEWVSWRYLIFGLVLIFIVVKRPQGLWPRRERRHDLGLQRDPS
jgi:branched-chain amino acid transport system permease protein